MVYTFSISLKLNVISRPEIRKYVFPHTNALSCSFLCPSSDKRTGIPCRRVIAQAASPHLWLRLTATIRGVQVTFPVGWLQSARLHLPKLHHLRHWSHMACDWSNELRPACRWKVGAGVLLWTYGKGKTLLSSAESRWGLSFLPLYLSSVPQVEVY